MTYFLSIIHTGLIIFWRVISGTAVKMPCYGISIAEAVARKQAIKWYTGLLARPYLPWSFDQNARPPNLPNGLGPASEHKRPPTTDVSPCNCTAGSRQHACMQAGVCLARLQFFMHLCSNVFAKGLSQTVAQATRASSQQAFL